MRFAEARDLIAQSAQAGIALKVVDGELRYAARNGALPSELRSRLQLLKGDLIAELSKPQFRIAKRQGDTVSLPKFMVSWWLETSVNQLLANATHIVWRLRGDLCASRFRAALDASVSRHDLLRGRILSSDGDLYLKFADAAAVATSSIERCNGSSLEEHADQRRAIEHVVWAPFEGGAVFRPFLMQISSTEIICGFVLHHFVADFQACRILARELYDGLHAATDDVTRPGDQPFQYSDYIRGMTEWLAGAAVRYRLDYWREHMSGAPRVCLPGAMDVDSAFTGPLRTVNFRIYPTLRARLADVAKSFEATLALVILAAKFVALSSTLRQSDVVVTALVSGRDDIALLKLVGNTTDCVPIRLPVRPEVPFEDFLEELQACYALACRYRVPWSIILETVKGVGGSTIAPTFNFVSSVVSESGQGIAHIASTSLSLESISLGLPQEFGSASWHTSHEMNLFDTGQYIEGHIKYMPLRHRIAAIEAFADCFMTCLERIAQDPGQDLGSLAPGAGQ